MKIIAFYLPQFHNIPENDEWWGEGFTEWTNVKKAKPLFKGHEQPKIPLNNNYYNLLDDDVKIWQANLAKKYGIYGFCYYHYWFNGKMLLEKPMEQMLANKKVDIPFCICWANEAWSKRWVGEGRKVLIKQFYGKEKEWIEHYNYFSKFFKDERYIFDNGMPVIVIYKPGIIPCMKDMLICWENCAKKDGFKGLTKMCVINNPNSSKLDENVYLFDYLINWEPVMSMSSDETSFLDPLKTLRRNFLNWGSIKTGIDLYQYSIIDKLRSMKNKKKNNSFVDFETVAKTSLNRKPVLKNNIPGGFLRLDNSPRYGNNGSGTKNENPEIFKKYLIDLIKNTKDVYEKDYIFFYAWNEWAEGGFLEPETIHKMEYLEAIKESLELTGEFPKYDNV